VVPRVLQFAIDDLYKGVTQAKLGRYSALLLVISATGGYFRYQMRRIIISASRGFEYDLRNDFFAHLEKLPLAKMHPVVIKSRDGLELVTVKLTAQGYVTQGLQQFRTAFPLFDRCLRRQHEGHVGSPKEAHRVLGYTRHVDQFFPRRFGFHPSANLHGRG
jgi:ABC-type multidrug transport system fused ATPase/permease subunit